MDNKPMTTTDVAANGSSENNEVTVRDAIERLNGLYAAVWENSQTVRQMFTDRGIKSRFGFYNNHAVAVGDGYVNELYPIPIVTAAVGGVSADIGFDIVSRNGSIGFLELTVDKAVLLGLDFSELAGFEFAIFGVEQYHTDYWSDDVAATKARIEHSEEKQFHIGFEFADMPVLIKLLNIFCYASGVKFEIQDGAHQKMLGEK